WMRSGEPGRVVVQDDRHVPRHLGEAVLEAEPQVLKLIENPIGAGEVGVVVARGEAQRIGLDPGDGARLPLCPGGTLPLGLELRLDAQTRQGLVCLLEARRWRYRGGERQGRASGRERIEEEGQRTECGELDRPATASDRDGAALPACAADRHQARL